MHRILATLIAAALTGGCAGPPACGDATAGAERAAAERRPLGSWIETVGAACRTEAETAWARRLQADCDPLAAFHAGRTGTEPVDGCDDAEFASALELGRMIGEMTRERDRVRSRLESGETDPGESARLRQRLMVIDRDLPQVEALARMRGLMTPAEVPETPVD